MPDSVQGQGGDKALWLVIWALVCKFKLSFSDAMTVALEYNQTKCRPPWPESKVEYKVRRALQMGSQPSPRPRVIPAIKADPAHMAENWLGGFRCSESELTAASPILPPCDWRLGAAWMLPYLFLQGERVNIITNYVQDGQKATPMGKGGTFPRDKWTEILSRRPSLGDAGAWIRLNPLDGRGVGDANVIAFRYGLLEFDSIPLELQLSLIARLPLPVAAVVTSGGRSVHAWLRVDAPNAESFRAQMSRVLARLAQFGADPRTSNPSRLARLPGVQRRIGAAGDGKQRLLYLNSRPKPEPILGERPMPAESVRAEGHHPWFPDIALSGSALTFPVIDNNSDLNRFENLCDA
jgi:hypothetical protein